VPQLGEQIQTYLHDFSSKAGQLTVWGLVFLLVSTLTLLSTIEDVFNDIWNVDSGRPWAQRLLVYWAMLTLGPILIAVSLSISSYFLSLTAFADASVLASLRTTLFKVLPFVFELAAFVLFYSMVPNCNVKLRHALVGGLVATVLFELAKYGFGFYLLHFNSYQLIYGAVAVLPIFLVWVYLSWLVVLIGATVAAALIPDKVE
jgi:membrane protein